MNDDVVGGECEETVLSGGPRTLNLPGVASTADDATSCPSKVVKALATNVTVYVVKPLRLYVCHTSQTLISYCLMMSVPKWMSTVIWT